LIVVVAWAFTMKLPWAETVRMMLVPGAASGTEYEAWFDWKLPDEVMSVWGQLEPETMPQLSYPVQGALSSPYGYRVNPATGKTESHMGVDFTTPAGTPVYAPAKGEVVNTYEDATLGTVLLIKHAGGLQTRYGHLGQVTIKVGDVVDKGRQIATVGEATQKMGPHLHFETIVDGKMVDPLTLLKLPGQS
jgi:murein DD-endopeptidase MepM/ murein hydrolase activator NlpD